jgi:NADPH:quinone reductase-like Zn-dependent oxidoreductase
VRACGVSEPGGVVQLLDLPEPAAPAAGQVLVAVEAAGMGPWDALLHTGGWEVGLRPPAALGVEGTGRVLAVGPGVRGLAVGDAVIAHEAPLPGGSGFWAEQVLLEASHLARRPVGLDPVPAAALPVGGLTARQALDRLAMRPGERLVVTGGAGGTGALVVQLAVRAGVQVTATASARNADRLRQLGAVAVIDYHDADWPARAGGPFDAAIVAAPGTVDAMLRLVRDGGRLCSLTGDAPPEERAIRSENLYVAPDAGQLDALAHQVRRGELSLRPEPVELAQAPIAFRRVAARATGGVKLVLVF